ncbi:hypothetical protein L2Y96_19405 [Luteibacter aegosomaticola]|uniref:hypothetical protein n=1 Tax=Luteibacter aegosomaticola TaxID=2911538 RepID=UPI001FF7FD5D|nr:hypothetical protein [Luteibacter aegosomaticola]UPG89541.1 hypothetical protein L2Y96_19405 [Luteibacter aegosomaticola]
MQTSMRTDDVNGLHRRAFRSRTGTFVVLALLWAPSCVLASSQRAAVCTRAMAMKAMTEADSLRTWRAVYASYERYRSCDDGAIAEGYSASIATLLADHWATLGELARLIQDDAHFEAFVLSHVDETIILEQGIAIKDHATRQCPKGSKTFCAKLKRRLTP